MNRELTLAAEHAEAAGKSGAWLAAIDGDLTAASAHMDTALGQLTRDQLLDRALVHVACAETSGVLGDVSAARAHRRSAIDLYRAKGNVVGAAHHEALLAASAG